MPTPTPKTRKRRTSKKPLSQAEVGKKYGFRSGLEEVVAKQLSAGGVSFEYEEHTIRYTKPAKPSRYTPDFIVGDEVAIEVKGYVWDEWNIERAELFMSQFPDYTYVVVGASLPSDHHLPWDQREGLTELI